MYVSVGVDCRNSFLRDKNSQFTFSPSLQITLAQSYVPVYLQSSTVHTELPSLYIKVVILALVILLPHVSFPSYPLHGLVQQLVPVCSLATSGVLLRLIISICIEHKVVLQLLLQSYGQRGKDIQVMATLVEKEQDSTFQLSHFAFLTLGELHNHHWPAVVILCIEISTVANTELCI